MGENSTISWTDHTFNPWIGCTKVSPGCANCYAERDWDKRRHVAQWGPMGTRIVTSDENWKKPLKWNRDAEKSGVRTRVFCASLADVFEDWPGGMRNHKGVELWSRGDGHWTEAPSPAQNADAIIGGYRAIKMTDVRRRLFQLIDSTPHLDWLLVTKRPENIRTLWPEFVVTPFDREEEVLTHRKNVWLLTSVENQEQADKRIPELLKCRELAPVLGLSCEPLLGPLDLTEDENYLNPECWGDCACDSVAGYDPGCRRNGGDGTLTRHLDWVIAGGESGPVARTMHPDWARSLRDQCLAAGVPFHFKQWGEWSPLHGTGRPSHEEDETDRPWKWISPAGVLSETGCEPDAVIVRYGKQLAGRLLDGREWDEFPQIASDK